MTTMTLNPGYWSRRSLGDWAFAFITLAGMLFAFFRYQHAMDVYEQGILLASGPAAVALGWFWRPLRHLMVAVAALSLAAIAAYNGQLARAEEVFWLKYFLSSQSAILWMCMLFFISTVFYWTGMLIRGQGETMERLGSLIAWVAVGAALVGTMVRWYESHQMGPDIGHIPVSNLYEVFVMFCWMTTLFYLYYEREYRTRALGAFVMLVVSAAVGFLLWYTLVREAHAIQPLVPALKSWWMKLHVPANFIGYGTFALAAMVAFAYLIKVQAQETRWYKLAPLWLLGIVLCFEPVVFRKLGIESISSYWMVYFGLAALIIAGILKMRARIAERLPALEVLDDVMYKSIAVGFAFFTIATVLGALWAAEAWGGYWSWDPKETWALITWLTYTAYLHFRLVRKNTSRVMPLLVIAGFLIAMFTFFGVNFLLSGLHSYA